MTEYLIIGQVARPHGIKGELKINPQTDDVKRFAGLNMCYVRQGKDYVPVRVNASRVSGTDVIILLDGISDRNAAERMRGEFLYVDRENTIPLPEGRYFICDLVGLNVFDDAGEPLGTITDVLQPGANDVYVVKNDNYTLMMPALKTLIKEVDIAGGRMVVSAQRLAEVALRED